MTRQHGHLLVLRGHHVPDLDQSQLSTQICVNQSQLTLTRWSWPTLATTPSASGWHFTIVHLSSCAGTCNQIFFSVTNIFCLQPAHPGVGSVDGGHEAALGDGPHGEAAVIQAAVDPEK